MLDNIKEDLELIKLKDLLGLRSNMNDPPIDKSRSNVSGIMDPLDGGPVGGSVVNVQSL